MIRKVFNKTKRYIADFGLRISSSAITTISNQLVLLPVLASIFSAAEYGAILTVVGIKNIIAGTLGNSLFSTRLVMESEYIENKVRGDFNRLSIFSSALSIIVMLVTVLFISELDTVSLIIIIPATVLYTFNAYMVVWYTVKLEFKKGLIHSIVVSIGTLSGVALVCFTHLWALAYLVTATFGFVFVTTQTGIQKEGFQRTRLLKKTTLKWLILGLATLLTNIVTYLDRLVLYPLLGSDAVATFYTASFFGKAVSVIAMPVAGVLLGYYAQKDYSMTLKKYWLINALCGGALLVFCIFTVFFGEAITGILFPKLIQDASPYIFIANMASAIAAIIQLVQAASLKYAKTYWQIVMQVIYLGVYFCLGMILMQENGLMGFCVAFLIANIARLVMLLTICQISIKNKIMV